MSVGGRTGKTSIVLIASALLCSPTGLGAAPKPSAPKIKLPAPPPAIGLVKRSAYEDCNAEFAGPLSGTPLRSLLDQAKAIASAHRDFETAAERKTRVSAEFEQALGSNARRLVVSFPLTPSSWTFDEKTGLFRFSPWEFGLFECSGFGSDVCAMRPISIAMNEAPTKAGDYVGTTGFGVQTKVSRLRSRRAGIIDQGAGERERSDQWNNNADAGHLGGVAFELDLPRSSAAAIAKDLQWYVVLEPQYPYYAHGFRYSDATLTAPVEERIDLETTFGRMSCIALGVPGQPPIAIRRIGQAAK